MLFRFLHFIGPMMWFGGAMAAMLISAGSSQASRESKVVVYGLLARVHAWVIAPGAIITTITGLLITVQMVTEGQGELLGRPGISAMMTGGLLATLLVVAVSLPAANRRAAIIQLEAEPRQEAILEKIRKRQMVSSMVAAVLVIISVVGVVIP